MNNIIELLHAGEYSCVISNGEDTRTFTQGGVRDLYDLHTSDLAFLKGASIADKVVGKAAAALMILGGVKHIYADVISESALALLNDTEIEVRSGQIVPFIQSRDKTGVCPLETKCSQTDSLPGLYLLIEEFMKKIRG